MRNNVVFPAPFGPTRPTFSPGFSWNEASTKSTCRPYCLLMRANEIMRAHKGTTVQKGPAGRSSRISVPFRAGSTLPMRRLSTLGFTILVLAAAPEAFGQAVNVSVATDGTLGNGPSATPALSGDGRFVAFVSSASNLVAGDTNAFPDVFLRDRDTDAD